MAFDAGPWCRGLVRIWGHLFIYFSVAPESWSSWAGCIREGRLSAKSDCFDAFSYRVRRGGFGGQKPCHLWSPSDHWSRSWLSTSYLARCRTAHTSQFTSYRFRPSSFLQKPPFSAKGMSKCLSKRQYGVQSRWPGLMWAALRNTTPPEPQMKPVPSGVNRMRWKAFCQLPS